MISKHISCRPENDNYARLANYIADASHEGEKALMSWTAGCWMEDDYDMAIQEVIDTQSLNTRTKQAKTYHLIISFRPEDEVKLTPEVFKDIEEQFARALGLSEHQRHGGVHKNTDNLHMHVAYNLIHPEKLTIHQPFRDYAARDMVCRNLELKYGLTVDTGKEKKQNLQKLTEPAARVEIQTGQQSFEGYAKSHTPAIMEQFQGVHTWQDMHELLAAYSMEIRPRGNGLIIKDVNSKACIKASTFSREFSLKKLESKLGAFTVGQKTQVQIVDTYSKKPVQRSPERADLFTEYKATMKEKREQQKSIKQKEEAQLTAIRERWNRQRQEITLRKLPTKTISQMLKITRVNEQAEMQQAKAAIRQEVHAVQKEKPFSSWNQFLAAKASQGNETALAILRSKDEVIEPEKPKLSDKELYERSKHEQYLLQKEKDILTSGLKAPAQRQLLSLLKMEKALEGQDFKYNIDKKGIVIYTLTSGGTIRDTGKEIHFSAHDAEAGIVAEKYAKVKWGKSVSLDGNTIKFQPQRKKEKKRDFGR